MQVSYVPLNIIGHTLRNCSSISELESLGLETPNFNELNDSYEVENLVENLKQILFQEYKSMLLHRLTNHWVPTELMTEPPPPSVQAVHHNNKAEVKDVQYIKIVKTRFVPTGIFIYIRIN
jgi:hypothetical protein